MGTIYSGSIVATAVMVWFLTVALAYMSSPYMFSQMCGDR